MVQIKPFGDRVVIEVIAPDEVVAGGLIVPTSKEKSNKGLVVSVGDGEDAQKIKEGDMDGGGVVCVLTWHGWRWGGLCADLAWMEEGWSVC